MNRPAAIAVCFTLALTPVAAAQQPLAEPPTSVQFLSRYDFGLSAAALASDDERFSWDVHFGGDIDVFDYVIGRVSSYMDYHVVLGNEFRPFDPNQGNYTLEVATSYRIRRTEVAAMFHHVSRHLSDRPKEFPIAWNILGVRVLRHGVIKGTTVDFIADLGGVTQRVNVDYRWSGNVDVVMRRQVARRVGIFARGVAHLNGVTDDMGRPTQSGGLAEGGVRLMGEDAVGELFVGFERRFDADPLDFEAQRWFMVGFRALRR